MSTKIEQHGWTAVPRSLSKLVASRSKPQPSNPIRCSDIPLPDSAITKRVWSYAQEKLTPETFNHSMRVFYYGEAIRQQHFPAWTFSSETYLLTCLLHDIGTTVANQESTFLSFEFQGGMISHELLLSNGSEAAQAEAVCETIIRHQDLGDTGNVAALTALVHFATVLDNAGLNSELVHQDTIRDVVKQYPRNGWTNCFASVVRKECHLKPWSNTTRIEGFAEMVEANELMRPFD